ncbi:hypothetical protein [Cytobacillus gottheilii]|uniref:hypothetical protein n=1 Tax=Cytobacillus gottheilii TaxID=859144 RepID=UPI0008299164|nr:hypothetical protein [Cytobacillus gottheilii]
MDHLKNIDKQLKKIGVSYDSFFDSLKDANKLSNKNYGIGKHIKSCWSFFHSFLKELNTLIRWIITILTIGIPVLIGFLRAEQIAIISAVPNSTFIIAGVFIFIIFLWWIDRRTIIETTEPTSELFHIGAFEKYRNKEYKRNFDFFEREAFSFEDLRKELEESNKEHKTDVSYYQDTLEEKDKLLTKSVWELAYIRDLINEVTIKHFNLEKLFHEVLLRISSLSQNGLNENELDFHHYFTVHRVDPKEFVCIFSKHIHVHQVGKNYPRNGSNHLIKTENIKQNYYMIKGKLISFEIKAPNNEKWIVTLYPKPRPVDMVQTEIDYDTMYIEDIISLWKSFVILISNNRSIFNSRGESKNVKNA